MLDPLSQSNVGANPAGGKSTPSAEALVRSQVTAGPGFFSGKLRSGKLRSGEFRSDESRSGRAIGGSSKAALPDNDFGSEKFGPEEFGPEYFEDSGLGAEGLVAEGFGPEGPRAEAHRTGSARTEDEGFGSENARSKQHGPPSVNKPSVNKFSVDKSPANKFSASEPDDISSSDVLASAPAMNASLKSKAAQVPSQNRVAKAKRRLLSQNGFLKRLDAVYWKRLIRYFYIRFLRIRSSPHAIARGLAAGMFAGAFPLLGFQSLIGITIAACVRGNKVLAAAGTWISNPITFVPLFALNFYVGRWLLRLPSTTALPPSPAGLGEWMTVGMDVAAAMMVGSFVIGLVFGVVGYYVGLLIAQRVRKAKVARRVAKRRRH